MHRSARHIFHIYHPAVALTYMLSALVFAMLTYQPVYIAISLFAGSAYSIYLNGFYRFRKTLGYAAVLFVTVAVINPLFNHAGATALFYFLDNPVTLQAAAFGAASGGMLASVLIWFSCWQKLITNDKFLYLFGRGLPTAALMLSMIVRLVPVTRYKLSCIRDAQSALGMDGKKRRLRQGIRAASILLGWAMEDCIETADSMKARGYGIGRRTSFSVFCWRAGDGMMLAVLLTLALVHAYVLLAYMGFDYFPTLRGSLYSPAGWIGYAAYAALLMFPLLAEGREALRWRS